MSCTTEISSLPILESCPNDDAAFLLSNVTDLISSDNPGGYGNLTFQKLLSCIAASFNINARIQFQVDVSDSYISNKINESDVQIPTDSDTSMVVNVAGIKNDSVELYLDGFLLGRELTDRNSYDVVYEDYKITINFFPNFTSNQLIVIRFNYNQS